MIYTEIVQIGTKQFRKTYSDTYQIQKIGTEEIYVEAYDLLTSNNQYVETDKELNLKVE